MFAALAISRYFQERSGVSIKKLLTTLRPVRSATIRSTANASPSTREYHHPPVNC
jgi:hypothetical protein